MGPLPCPLASSRAAPWPLLAGDGQRFLQPQASVDRAIAWASVGSSPACEVSPPRPVSGQPLSLAALGEAEVGQGGWGDPRVEPSQGFRLTPASPGLHGGRGLVPRCCWRISWRGFPPLCSCPGVLGHWGGFPHPCPSTRVLEVVVQCHRQQLLCATGQPLPLLGPALLIPHVGAASAAVSTRVTDTDLRLLSLRVWPTAAPAAPAV